MSRRVAGLADCGAGRSREVGHFHVHVAISVLLVMCLPLLLRRYVVDCALHSQWRIGDDVVRQLGDGDSGVGHRVDVVVGHVDRDWASADKMDRRWSRWMEDGADEWKRTPIIEPMMVADEWKRVPMMEPMMLE
jgi:hypothetical protein